MRVYRWAIRLQAKLGGNLDVIVLAALLHDVGWDENRPHNEVSAEIDLTLIVPVVVDRETFENAVRSFSDPAFPCILGLFSGYVLFSAFFPFQVHLID